MNTHFNHRCFKLRQIRLFNVAHRDLKVRAASTRTMPATVLDRIDGVVLQRANRFRIARVVTPLQSFGVRNPVLSRVERIFRGSTYGSNLDASNLDVSVIMKYHRTTGGSHQCADERDARYPSSVSRIINTINEVDAGNTRTLPSKVEGHHIVPEGWNYIEVDVRKHTTYTSTFRPHLGSL